MDISAIIFAWMISMNALFAQGYSYDYNNNTVNPPVQTRELRTNTNRMYRYDY